MKKYLLSLLILVTVSTVIAQNSPGDNDPKSAKSIIEIEASPSFNRSVSTLGCTPSAGIPTPGTCTQPTIKDVWFKTIVRAGKTDICIELQNVTTGNFMTDAVMAIYKGTSTNLTYITCDDNSGAAANMPKIVANGLTVDDTIFIRIWANGTTALGQAKISVYEPAQVNDECGGAINIDVAKFCEYKEYEFLKCSPSDLTKVTSTNPGCTFTQGAAPDIWFKFTAPASGRVRVATVDPNYDPSGFGTNLDGAMAIYESTGNGCSNLKYIDCSDELGYKYWMPFLDLTTLTPGKEYYIVLWDQRSNIKNRKTVPLSVYELPVEPTKVATSVKASNNPEDAPSICTFEGYWGNTRKEYDTLHPSTSYLQNNVIDYSLENNSWLKFIAKGTSVFFNFYISNCKSTGGVGGVQMQIFEVTNFNNGYISKSNCVTYGAIHNGFLYAENLTPGKTYYLMADGFDNDICDYVIQAADGIEQFKKSPDANICSGQSYNLTASGAGNGPYTWTGSDGSNHTGQNIPINPTQTTTYTITVPDVDAQCITVNNQSNVVVTVGNPKAAFDKLDTTICSLNPYDVQINLTGTAPWNFTYTSNGTSVPVMTPISPYITTITPTGSGLTTYEITYAKDKNCASVLNPDSIKSTVTIQSSNVPTTLAVTDPGKICTGKTATLDAKTAADEPNFPYKYVWLNSNTKDTLGTDATLTYTGSTPGSTKIAITKKGCQTVSDTVTLNVEDCLVDIPNVITANKDGKNDVFYIQGLIKYPNTSLVVFNRWGNKVYESSNYQNDWDADGVPSGTYYYIITFPAETLEPATGTITIVK